MTSSKTIRWGYLLIAFVFIMTCLTTVASAQTETVLYTFTGLADGGNPSDLIADSHGNFYGVNVFGGSYTGVCSFPGCGNVFELSPNGSGGWNETALYDFSGGSDGGIPFSRLYLDASGNLFGTTENGGDTGDIGCGGVIAGCGVVFELSPNGIGSWNESTIYTFTSATGALASSLVSDGANNLYGVTDVLGKNSFGNLFELSPNGSGAYTYRTIYSFTSGKDGGRPNSVVIDSTGDLFVSTTQGGVTTGFCTNLRGCGTIDEFKPNSSGNFGGHVVYAFQGKRDGAFPVGLSFDNSGNLFGSTVYGGLDSVCTGSFLGCGVVFKFSPISGGGLRGQTIYLFTNGSDGAYANTVPSFDSSGNVYVASQQASTCSFCGSAIKLTPSGGNYTESTLYSFTGGTDGGVSNRLYVDSSGTIYGTTLLGGDLSCQLDGPPGCGVFYQITQ